MSAPSADIRLLLYIQENILQMTSMQDIVFQTDTSSKAVFYFVLFDDSILILDTRASSAFTGWLVVGSVCSCAILSTTS